MTRMVKAGALAALMVLSGGSALRAAEPQSVKVTLGEQGGHMLLALSADRLKAGTVEFEVSNTSKMLMHEFLITPWNGKPGALPYDAKDQQVDEDALPHLQGVEDMPAGHKATLRLVLAPGRYVVFCDQPGHYRDGMFHVVTVTR